MMPDYIRMGRSLLWHMVFSRTGKQRVYRTACGLLRTEKNTLPWTGLEPPPSGKVCYNCYRSACGGTTS